MPTKVLDMDKVVELLRKYRPALLVEKGGGGKTSFRFLCPFHGDTKPSFVFTLTAGKGKCFSCKEQANLLRLIAAFERCSVEQAHTIEDTCKKFVKNDSAAVRAKNIDISQAQVDVWHKALETDTRLLTLLRKWGWGAELIERFLLGSSDGRLTIPMFEGEHLIGLKYYSPGSASMKYQNVEGSAQVCWPLENLQEDAVYLVEGEKDCLTMIAAGFNAVTFTTGAGSIAKDYIRFFAGREVYIIYDIDEIGRKGAVVVANMLSFAARKVYVIDLPLEGIPKGDLTDAYMQDPEGFVDFINHLRENTSEYQPPAVVTRVAIDPEVRRTYLENIVPHSLFYKRVKMKVRVVSNAQQETIIVPKDVHITCGRDYKDVLCQQCPLFFKHEGVHIHVKPEYPELLSMVGNNIKVQRAALQSMTDIIEGCTKFKIAQKSHQALYPIVIIPAIEADKKHHNYQMVEAWALNVPSKENVDYEVEGVVLANPDTQHMELVCYKMVEDEESIDSFELTEQMVKDLEIFACLPPHELKLITS